MKVLLHTCCAPCLIYPLERLKKGKFEVTGFFYNPNIFPQDEYQMRRQAVLDLSTTKSIEVIYPPYMPSEYSDRVLLKQDRPERCVICWRFRLQRTAREAKERGFPCFSTTLLVSPYQDQDALKRLGEEVAAQEGIAFYYEDFRPGFKKAHDAAKACGMYCQNYCGCMYSKAERSRK